jgi:DNA-binding SARP family transcriptional activator
VIDVAVLGTVEVAIAGTPISLAPRHRKILAALVLRAPTALSIDEMAEVLWPVGSPVQAAISLQNAIVKLRQQLGRDTIETVPSGYRLAMHDRIEVDVRVLDRFTAELVTTRVPAERLALVRRATALFRGRPYADLIDWPSARGEISRLDQMHSALGDTAAECLLHASDANLAMAELTALAEAEPLRELRWAALMRALYRCGRQADALRVCSNLRSSLVEELGLDLSPELRSLESQILQQAAELDGPSPTDSRTRQPRANLPASVRSIVRGTSFVNRVHDLDVIARTNAVVLTGEAGIGKTRLAAEYLTGLNESTDVLHVRCAGENEAWSPVQRAVREWASTIEATRSVLDDVDLARLVPELVSPFTAPAEALSDETGAILRGVLALLTQLAMNQPVVLFVDDLHEAKPALLETIVALVSRVDPQRIRIVATTRHDTSVLQQFACAGGTVHVVEPLRFDDVEALATALDVDVDVADVHERAGGNPLFVTHLLTGGRDGDVPATIAWSIRARVGALGPPTYDLMLLLAIDRKPIESAVLAHATGNERDLGHFASLVTAAIDQRLIAESSDGQLAVAHPVVREVLRDELSALRLATLHERLLDAYEAVSADDLESLSFHAQRAGAAGRVRSYGYIDQLARRYHADLRLDESRVLWVQLDQIAAQDATATAHRVNAKIGLARVLARLGDQTWVQPLETAFELALTDPSIDIGAVGAAAPAGSVSTSAFDAASDRYRALVRRTLRVADDRDSLQRAVLLSNAGRMPATTGPDVDRRALERHVRDSWEMLLRLDLDLDKDAASIVQIAATAATTLVGPKDLGLRDEATHLGMRVFQTTRRPADLAAVLVARAWVAMELGEFSEVDDLLGLADGLPRAVSRATVLSLPFLRISLMTARGHLDEANTALNESGKFAIGPFAPMINHVRDHLAHAVAIARGNIDDALNWHASRTGFFIELGRASTAELLVKRNQPGDLATAADLLAGAADDRYSASASDLFKLNVRCRWATVAAGLGDREAAAALWAILASTRGRFPYDRVELGRPTSGVLAGLANVLGRRTEAIALAREAVVACERGRLAVHFATESAQLAELLC